MSISFQCTCGKTLKSQEELAGRKTKCPHCGAILIVPGTPARPVAVAVAVAAPSNPDALLVEGLDWTSSERPATETSASASSSASAVGPTLVPAPSGDPIRPSDLPRPDDGSMQYKVLSQKDHSATGKINFANLEVTLNEHARHGWTVKSAVVINLPGHSGNHDELVLILER